MYWKVRKLSLKDIAVQNWPYFALALSVFINLILIVSRPSNSKGMSGELKLNYDKFARDVTIHLLDTSYISYKNSTFLLGGQSLSGGGELERRVLESMKQSGLIAKNSEEMEATGKTLLDSRQVSAVRIDQVDVQPPPAPNKPIPVEVSGVVAIHSAQDSAPTNPVPFHFHYDMALKPGENGQPALGADGKPLPMVVGFREVGGQ